MSQITKPIILDETGQKIVGELQGLKRAIEKGAGGTVYGFHINGNESDPEAAVTYLGDAMGLTPAHMNYSTGAFDYGSWEDAFFMPRPCMLKNDGSVDYYLNVNNYAKKADGVTNSDIANSAYAGNAMMEWGRDGKKIWLKIEPSADKKSARIYIADYQADDSFHDWSFHDANGNSVDHFYTPIYNGSVSDGVMRSLSGQALSKTINTTAQRTAAKANNPSGSLMWDIECFADRLLINMLLVLMGKNLDTQKVFGQGATSGGNEEINDTYRTGVHNDKGLFYGTNSGSVAANSFGNCVKVFGMENYWGLQWRRTCGLMMSGGDIKVKLTRVTEDGTTVTDYNENASGYISTGISPSNGTENESAGGYIKSHKFSDKGMFMSDLVGDSAHYYCDYGWYHRTATTFALFGGASDYGSNCGAFYCHLNGTAGGTTWNVGAALSCKPLAAA